MDYNQRVKEAVSYFQAREGFHSLFLQLTDKYRSYGRFGGNIVIDNPSDNEKEHLSLFTGEDYSRNAKITLKVELFERLLENGAFSVDLKDLVENYFGMALLTKKEERDNKIRAQDQFFSQFKLDHKNEYAVLLKRAIEGKEKGTKGVYDLYKKDSELLKEILDNIYQSFHYLPKVGYVRLPMLATEATGNPHYFDGNTQAGSIYLSCLQIILYQIIEKEIISNPNTEEKTEIFDYFGISRDDVNNDVTVFGMIELESGEETLLSKAIRQRKKVMKYPLRELSDLQQVMGTKNSVFVIENSGLYSDIVDLCQSEEVDSTIICSSGQLNLSVWILIEKFVKNGNRIYYSGDHDPEGILMATRLKNRFNDSFIFWDFSVESYLQGLSDESISQSRLMQLNSVNYKELEGLVSKILETRKCSYQEKRKNKLFNDIKNMIGSVIH